MPLRGIGTGRQKRHLNAEVNIINLVDVVLVLLLIFMLTAPMLQGGVEVKLPRAATRPLVARDGVTITVTRGGQVAIGEARMSLTDFRAQGAAALKLKNPEAVYIRGDDAASYGTVIQVLAAVREAGITNVGLVVEQESRQ